ncbi:MAG: autotransporter domain-containing protein [Phycisphaeraceae bacterium]|nr:autotransporter domain-containing protein [Phycisphaeraceae bacterium]
MTDAPTADKQARTPRQRGRGLRVSTRALLAAGALAAGTPALGQVAVTNPAEFSIFLNDASVGELQITGGDLDLSASPPFNMTIEQIIEGDGTTRTISDGDITILNNAVLAINPDAIWDGDINVLDGGRVDLTAPTTLGATGTVDLEDLGELRIFGLGDTYDATFWAKVTGTAGSSIVSFSANDSTITALPTFNADIAIVVYDSFQFTGTPLTDPELILGATLVGSNAVTINAGTLNLANFDLTIGSLEGVADSEITLGTGTLTTGDATSTAYAGVISGTGNLVKTGTGTFTLSGVNTYTGTATVTGGTLVFEADQSGIAGSFIQNGATLLINADQTGNPFYEVSSGGTLTVNADLGDATILDTQNGGTITLNNVDQTIGELIGTTGTLTLNEVNLTVDDAGNNAFGGVLAGTGNLTKAGAGNFTLSGMNTFSGMTTISAGTITLDGDLLDTSTVAIATGAILDLNGNNETLGTITGTGGIMLDTATLTVGNSSTFTFGGTISETGGLTKQGTGTMTLSSAQTYTGATNINAGTLIVNGDLATSGVTVGNGATFNLEGDLTAGGADLTVDAGGTFFGTTTIGNDLINNGTVTLIGPGAGDTITVNGNYTQGATGLLNIQLGSAGGLVVTGNANVSGTLDVGIPADPANFDITATYNAITAGSITGTFDTVTDNFAFLDLTNANVGGNIEITLARNAVAISDITRNNNQANVANILDTVGPTGNLDAALDRILASSEDGARLTLDALAGGAAATTSTQSAANAVNQSHRLLDQVVGVSPATSRPRGSFSMAPSTNGFEEVDHLTLLSFYQGEAEEAEGQGPTIAGLSPLPWGKIYGGFGDQGDGAEGLDYTRYGLLVGLELESAESDARYGLSLGVEQTDFDLNQDNGDIDISSLYLSGYTRQPLGNDMHVTFAGGLGYHSHDSTRNILIGVTPTQASADFDSFSVSLAAEISKTFTVVHTPVDPGGHPTDTAIEPFARLDYSLSDQDGYSETGAGSAGLNVSSSEFDSVRAALGVRVQHQYMLANQYEAVLRGRGLVNVAISNSDSGLNVSFVGTPGSSFAVEGSDQDDIFGQIGFGLSVEINDSWDLHIDLDQQFSGDAMGTLVSGGLSYEF